MLQFFICLSLFCMMKKSQMDSSFACVEVSQSSLTTVKKKILVTYYVNLN